MIGAAGTEKPFQFFGALEKSIAGKSCSFLSLLTNLYDDYAKITGFFLMLLLSIPSCLSLFWSTEIDEIFLSRYSSLPQVSYSDEVHIVEEYVENFRRFFRWTETVSKINLCNSPSLTYVFCNSHLLYLINLDYYLLAISWGNFHFIFARSRCPDFSTLYDLPCMALDGNKHLLLRNIRFDFLNQVIYRAISCEGWASIRYRVGVASDRND